MQPPKFNTPISEQATEYIEPGQVFATAANSDQYRERTGVVRVIEAPDEHPDALVEVLESWDGNRSGSTTSTSPTTFIARLYHRE